MVSGVTRGYFHRGSATRAVGAPIRFDLSRLALWPNLWRQRIQLGRYESPQVIVSVHLIVNFLSTIVGEEIFDLDASGGDHQQDAGSCMTLLVVVCGMAIWRTSRWPYA